MTTNQLIRAAEKTAQIAEQASRRFAVALAQVLRETERRLRPLLRDVSHGDRTALIRAAQANQTREDLRRILTEGGFDDLAGVATNTPLDRLAAQVLGRSRLATQSADLLMDRAISIEALKHLQLQELLDQGDDVANALTKATIRGVFNSRDVDAILDDLGFVLDDSEAGIRTLYDTSVSIFGRQVEALQSGEDPDATFAYMGPVDDVTRDFCLNLVGKVFTHAEIDDMDNGQIDNVFLTGGGYNCRHVWMEVSKFSELQDLGNQRVPEVQAQIDELAA